VPAWQASGQVTEYQRRPGGNQAAAWAHAAIVGPGIHSRFVKIVLDADRCTGHGRCYSLAPELFDSDDEGHSVVLASEVPAGLESQARLAVENCPETCISLQG
jgi:ferredoxin